MYILLTRVYTMSLSIQTSDITAIENVELDGQLFVRRAREGSSAMFEANRTECRQLVY